MARLSCCLAVSLLLLATAQGGSATWAPRLLQYLKIAGFVPRENLFAVTPRFTPGAKNQIKFISKPGVVGRGTLRVSGSQLVADVIVMSSNPKVPFAPSRTTVAQLCAQGEGNVIYKCVLHLTGVWTKVPGAVPKFRFSGETRPGPIFSKYSISTNPRKWAIFIHPTSPQAAQLSSFSFWPTGQLNVKLETKS